jgi:hypothetical protein
LVPKHGDADGEELASDRDESNHFWRTDSAQAAADGIGT